MRGVIRWSGYALLAAAMVLGLRDGIRSISVSSLVATPLGEAASGVFPGHAQFLEQELTQRLHPWLWDPLLLNVLSAPAAPALFALGGLLMLLARPKEPPPIERG